MFIPLHCHSEYSFCAGLLTIEELVKQSQAFGMNGCALTDTNRVSGLIRFYCTSIKHGIKPILGVELTEVDSDTEYVILLAKNNQGYKELCEITTKRHDSTCTTIKTLLEQSWENLIIITHSISLLMFLHSTVNKPHVYGELINYSKESRQRSKRVESYCKENNIPLVVTNNTYFLNKEQWYLHTVLRAIDKNSTLSRLHKNEYAPQGAYFRQPEEMYTLFPNHHDAVNRSGEIADLCNVHFDLYKWIFPTITVPAHHTPHSYLTKIAYDGLKKNYAHKETYTQAKDLQKLELDVVQKLGYSSYFLIVKKIRQWANNHFAQHYRREKDCSILRGSAANSLTLYNIGVSDLDPIELNLYFQRFLNEDRASPPDADLDFAWDERDEVLQYIFDTYGEDHTAMICTTNHFKFKSAFRETAKVFGYSDEHITHILKSQKLYKSKIETEEIRNILYLAKQIEGKPHFLGQHPGGVVITNEPIWHHVACEYSGGLTNRRITQIDMHNGIDELGLIKFDILGNGSLAVLRDTLDQIYKEGYDDPKVWDLQKCFSDSKTKQLIRTGETKGIFYIESPAQSRLNAKAQVDTFDEIAITSSLVRPAGNAYLHTFIDRHIKMKHNIVDWEFLHPALKPILQETHDTCAFQEDVIKICHEVAGLSFKKADKIRKMMNSLHEGMLTSEEFITVSQEFIEGCIQKNSFTQKQAEILWDRIKSFQGFSFCKSHSASYAQLSFQCTYLKAHYPAQFIAALLSNNHGFYHKAVYLHEARRLGVTIRSVDINQSEIKFYGDTHHIHTGFMDIRNLSHKSMYSIIEERTANGIFNSLRDFVHRVSIGKKEVENLIKVNAFSSFPQSQPQLLFLLDDLFNHQQQECTPTLFDSFPINDTVPQVSDYTITEKCLNEKEILGYMVSGDSVKMLQFHPAAKDRSVAQNLSYFINQRIKVFGALVTRRTHPIVKKGTVMQFMTLMDETGYIDIVFWPETYHRYHDTIHSDGPFEVYGIVKEDWGTFTIEGKEIYEVEWSPQIVDYSLIARNIIPNVNKELKFYE